MNAKAVEIPTDVYTESGQDDPMADVCGRCEKAAEKLAKEYEDDDEEEES